MVHLARAKVLSEGAIAGSGLDVFEKEQVSLKDPILRLQNAVLAPHIGTATKAVRKGMAICDAENIVAVMKRTVPPPNVVPERHEMIFGKQG